MSNNITTAFVKSRQISRAVKMKNVITESVVDGASKGETSAMKSVIDNLTSISFNTESSVMRGIETLNKGMEILSESQRKDIIYYFENKLSTMNELAIVKKHLRKLKGVTEHTSERLNDLIIADRILNNNAKLNEYAGYKQASKLFGESAVMGMAKVIDEYNMKDSIKMNVALENIKYSLENNGSKINELDLLFELYTYCTLAGKDTDLLESIINKSPVLSEGAVKAFNEADDTKDIIKASKPDKIDTDSVSKSIFNEIINIESSEADDEDKFSKYKSLLTMVLSMILSLLVEKKDGSILLDAAEAILGQMRELVEASSSVLGSVHDDMVEFMKGLMDFKGTQQFRIIKTRIDNAYSELDKEQVLATESFLQEQEGTGKVSLYATWIERMKSMYDDSYDNLISFYVDQLGNMQRTNPDKLFTNLLAIIEVVKNVEGADISEGVFNSLPYIPSMISSYELYHTLSANQKDSLIASIDRLIDSLESCTKMEDYKHFAVSERIISGFMSLRYDIERCKLENFTESYLLEFEGSKFDKGLTKIVDSKFKDPRDIKNASNNLRAVIKKLFTKSEKEIVTGLPSVFKAWKLILLGAVLTGGIAGVAIGIPALITSGIISMNMNRKNVVKIKKQYESNLADVEKKLDKAKEGSKKKEVLTKAKEELKGALDTIEDYEDKLHTEEENDKRKYGSDDDSDDMSFDESFRLKLPVSVLKEARTNHDWDVVTEAEDGDDISNTEINDTNDLFDRILNNTKMTLSDFMGTPKTEVAGQIFKAVDILRTVMTQRFKSLIDTDVIDIVSDADVDRFVRCANLKEMARYVTNTGAIDFKIATFLPMNLPKDITNARVMDYLNEICDALQDYLDPSFCVIFDGDRQLYKIYIEYNANIVLNDEEKVRLPEAVVETAAPVQLCDTLISNINLRNFNKEAREAMKPIIVLDPVICKGYAQLIANMGNKKIIEETTEEYSDLLKQLREFAANTNNANPVTGKSIYEVRDYVSEGVRILKTPVNELNMSDTIDTLIVFNEMTQAVLNESSPMKTLQATLTRMKAKAKGLTDKEKSMSNELDRNFEKFNDDIQKYYLDKNREKLIKGTSVPSISRIIKGAIIGGTAFFINPAIAVIGAVGMLAMSKRTTAKQKQQILDEIDINIKLVEKKIQLAESNNDMKAMEELLKVDRKLKREKERIIYKMKHYYVNVSSEH